MQPNPARLDLPVASLENAEQGKETNMARKRAPHSPRFRVVIDIDLIEISKERDSSHCMIAEAIRDVIPAAHSIAVDLQTIRFSLPEKRLRYTYLTPRIAQTALVQFDQGTTPEPFDFRLQGGQVTAMASRKSSNAAPRSKERTPAQIASLKKARKSAGLEKQRLATPTAGGGVMRRVGGRTPPTTPFGRRRAFGLRALSL